MELSCCPSPNALFLTLARYTSTTSQSEDTSFEYYSSDHTLLLQSTQLAIAPLPYRICISLIDLLLATFQIYPPICNHAVCLYYLWMRMSNGNCLLQHFEQAMMLVPVIVSLATKLGHKLFSLYHCIGIHWYYA